ncbi:MAG: VOC family protein [Ignavibacteriota bacterium]
MKIPEGYQQIMPYLIVKDAAGFMQFMENVFGAKEKFKMMRDEHIIAHAEINVGDSVVMLAESTDAFKVRTAGMFIYVEDADETYHKALQEGATSIMVPSDQEYGRTCGITDPFGNIWWPTTHKG